MILDKARENGASVLEETQAKSLIKSENRVEGVVVESKDLGELELHVPPWSLTRPGGIALPPTRKSG